MSLAELPAGFRAKAEEMREMGAETQAKAIEWCAAQAEEALRDSFMQPLTLTEAEAESGYERRQLSRMVREGTVPNAGERGAPRILRMHLPRKPGHGVAETRPQVASSRTQSARAVVGGR